MDPINWAAVAVSSALAPVTGLLWYRVVLKHPRSGVWNAAMAAALHFVAALMIGHALARIGADRLAVKPWLYWMQTGGIALAFIIPAVWTSYIRIGARFRDAMADAGYWVAVYLVTGTVFWAFR